MATFRTGYDSKIEKFERQRELIRNTPNSQAAEEGWDKNNALRNINANLRALRNSRNRAIKAQQAREKREKQIQAEKRRLKARGLSEKAALAAAKKEVKTTEKRAELEPERRVRRFVQDNVRKRRPVNLADKPKAERELEFTEVTGEGLKLFSGRTQSVNGKTFVLGVREAQPKETPLSALPETVMSINRPRGSPPYSQEHIRTTLGRGVNKVLFEIGFPEGIQSFRPPPEPKKNILVKTDEAIGNFLRPTSPLIPLEFVLGKAETFFDQKGNNIGGEVAGTIKEVVTRTINRPVTTAAIVGAGYGVGRAVSLLPTLGGVLVRDVALLGTAAFAGDTAFKGLSVDDKQQRRSFVGTRIQEAVAFGTGAFSSGLRGKSNARVKQPSRFTVERRNLGIGKALKNITKPKASGRVSSIADRPKDIIRLNLGKRGQLQITKILPAPKTITPLSSVISPHLIFAPSISQLPKFQERRLISGVTATPQAQVTSTKPLSAVTPTSAIKPVIETSIRSVSATTPASRVTPQRKTIAAVSVASAVSFFPGLITSIKPVAPEIPRPKGIGNLSFPRGRFSFGFGEEGRKKKGKKKSRKSKSIAVLIGDVTPTVSVKAPVITGFGFRG